MKPTKSPSREEIEFEGLCKAFGYERHLLTPLLDGERIRIWISLADSRRIIMAGRRPGLKGHVTDLDTGRVYAIWGAPCSLPRCYCDATAELQPSN